jgi:hypothetical protein
VDVTRRYSREVLPQSADFRLYRKTSLTQMVRIQGPFEVQTREGLISCADGWLALDSAGWPYPVAADEQAVIYELVTDQ